MHKFSYQIEAVITCLPMHTHFFFLQTQHVNICYLGVPQYVCIACCVCCCVYLCVSSRHRCVLLSLTWLCCYSGFHKLPCSDLETYVDSLKIEVLFGDTQIYTDKRTIKMKRIFVSLLCDHMITMPRFQMRFVKACLIAINPKMVNIQKR